MMVGINYVKKYSYTYVEFNTVEEARHAFRYILMYVDHAIESLKVRDLS